MTSTRTLKVLIIGDGSVGKTSLRSRYLNDSYKNAYISTIGADFISKTLEVSVPVPIISLPESRARTTTEAGSSNKQKQQLPSAEEDEHGGVAPKLHSPFQIEKFRVTLSIWDTAGQERFKSLGSAFYRGSDAVIIAFDLSKKGSLARTINWYNDFCRLGDIGFEDKSMNNRQLKRAREQKERFCWVGVGCKGDLLEVLRRGNGSETGALAAEPEWKGTSWTEARGWFDTMIPRYLPDGEVEKQRYPSGTENNDNGESSLPFAIKEEVPARPEDVLSRPNKLSSSSESTDVARQSGLTPGRPADAGLPPGNAPAPGSHLYSKRLHRRSDSKSKGMREKRKSIRSIDVWQGKNNSPPSSSTETINSSANTASSSVPISNAKDRNIRGRFDSTTSVGAPSIYYSVRGSTIFSQSPAGASASSPDGSEAPSETTTATNVNSGRQHSRGISLSSQARIRKQSNLSEVVTNEDEEHSGTTSGAPSTLTNGSSKNTIRGLKEEDVKGGEASSRSEEQESYIKDGASIPTVPSGDPIPFPSSDDYDDDDEEARAEEEEVPKRRGTSQKRPQSMQANSNQEEGEIGRKAKVIAEQTQQDITENQEEQHRLGLDGEPIDPRATLYSARPSSISSTIKAADDSIKSEGEDIDQEVADPGLLYRDQMIEQGFRLFFTSAKDDEGVDEVFEHIAKRVAMRWKLEEWEEQKERERGGEVAPGQVRTAPPTDEEVERERVRRAIRISSGKGTGNCCF